MKFKNCRFYLEKRKSTFPSLVNKKIPLLLMSGLLFSNVMGNIAAQTLSLKTNKISFVDALEKIRLKTNLDLVGDLNLLANTKPVTLNVKNKELNLVFKELSVNQPVELTLKNNTIIVKKKAISNSVPLLRKPGVESVTQEFYLLVGTVTDEDNQPLQGVNVKLLRTENLSSTTSKEGTYSLNVSKDSELLFTMVGYQSLTVAINSRKQLNVKLKQVKKEIEETIVTAYSKFNKNTFSGAVNTITKQDIQKISSPNILTIIQSLDASFVLRENNAAGSNPNAVPESSMRGIGNITGASSNPLILLDGFQISMRELYDIDIERIQSIHILKDATATALYGSRGANGVIQIETSLPKDGKLTIGYSILPTANFVDLSSYNLMNASEKLAYEKLAGLYNYNNGVDHALNYYNQVQLDNEYNQKLRDVLEGVDTYWLKQPIQSTFQTSHNLTIGGGANNVRYQISGNYADRKGTMKGADRKNYGANFRLEYRLPNKFTFSNLAVYTGVEGNNSPYGSFSSFTTMNPYWRIIDENNEFISRYEGNVYNPLFVGSLNNVSANTEQNIRNNTSLEWRPTDTWLLNATASIAKIFNSRDNFISPFHPQYIDETNLAKKGRYTVSKGDNVEFEGRMSARYNKVYDKHIVAAQLTGELRSVTGTTRGFIVTGFSTDEFRDPSLAIQYAEGSRPSSTENRVRTIGSVASLDYSYDERYSTQMSLRLDASSLYGKNERYQYFPSIGARWNINKEKFFKNIEQSINRLSLRGSYGIASSGSFNSYQAISTYSFIGDYYYNTAVSNLISYGNPDLKWQKNKQFNAGLDVEVLDRRIGLQLDYYNNMNDGMVISVDSPPSLGFSNFASNLGSVRNRGLEATLTAFIIQKTDFSIKSITMVSRNKSKLLNLSPEYLDYLNLSANSSYVPVTKYIPGQSLENIIAVRSLGIDPANGKEIFLTKDNQQTYIWNADDRVIIGEGAPKFRGAQNFDIFYKNFTLFVSGQYSFGADVYNQTLLTKVENVNPNLNGDRRVLTGRWQRPGDVTFFKDIADRSQTRATSRFIQNENYFNFTNVTLSYNDRRNWLKKYKIVALSYSLSANNFARFSTIERERGTEYPFERSISGSLRITF